jgi:hypothetical protein
MISAVPRLLDRVIVLGRSILRRCGQEASAQRKAGSSRHCCRVMPRPIPGPSSDATTETDDCLSSISDLSLCPLGRLAASRVRILCPDLSRLPHSAAQKGKDSLAPAGWEPGLLLLSRHT